MQKTPKNLALRHLHAFMRVAQERSFVDAARSMHCTPSVLSENIRQLERVLGVKLFDRTTRSVQMTDAGREFLADAGRVLEMLELSVANARARAAGVRGTVRVAAIPSIMQVLVLPAVETFASRYSDVRLQLIELRGLTLSHAVRDGDVDIGLGGMLHPVTGVLATPLFNDELGLIASPDHPLLRLRMIDWKHLAGAKMVALEGDEVTRGLLRGVPDASANLFDPQFVAGSNEALAGLIERGLAVAMLSAMSSHHSAFARLAFRPVGRPSLVRAMCLQVHEHRSLSVAAKTLMSCIEDQVQRLGFRRDPQGRNVVRSRRAPNA